MEYRKKSTKMKRREQGRKIRDKWEGSKRKWSRNEGSAGGCNRQSQCRAFTEIVPPPTICNHPECGRIELERETEGASSLKAKEMWTDRKFMTVKGEIIEELHL